MRIEELIKKLNYNNIEKNKERKQQEKEEYGRKLNDIKRNVEQSLNEGYTGIVVEGYCMKEFAERYFKNSRVCCSGDCITQYYIEINEKGLRKLEKDLLEKGKEE